MKTPKPESFITTPEKGYTKRTRGDTTTIDFIKEADEFLQKKNSADEKAGYPPNCNKGYVEKDGKCVPSE
mgnify:CR=1 FL=1